MNFTIFLGDISNENIYYSIYWFNRIFYYSIIPLCVLASIGFIKLIKILKNNPKFSKIFTKKRRKTFIKFLSFSLLIFLVHTNLVITGIRLGNKNKAIEDEKIEVIIWISEHIPRGSNFLIDDLDDALLRGIHAMADCYLHLIKSYFKSDVNETENIEDIDNLIDNKIKYLMISEEYIDETDKRATFVLTYLIPNFYNDTLYRSDEYRIYYAPYFE